MFKGRLKHFSVYLMAALFFQLYSSAVAAELGLTSEQLQFLNDISIAVEDVEKPSDIVVGKTVRVYATVHNNSDKDQKGVVRFYNERTKQFLGSDQPFSAVANGTDTVFIDIQVGQAGESPVAIRIIPDENKGDNPANDKITTGLIADYDSDLDGVSNRTDPDNDNDGAADAHDVFPLDPFESKDTDSDGVGNNADIDDDNDGVFDVQDAFPQDANELQDSDKDGVGENKDVFPQDPKESKDSDNDGIGDNSDTNNQNQGPVIVLNMESSGIGGGGGDSRGGGGGSGGGSRWKIIAENDGPDVENNQNKNTGSTAGSDLTAAKNAPAATLGTIKVNALPVFIRRSVGELITFDSTGSYDKDGKIAEVQWDFGDGANAVGATAKHIYKTKGEYQAKIIITDDKGESREQIITVAVHPSLLPFGSVAVGLFLLVFLLLAMRRKPKFKKSLLGMHKSSKIHPL